MPEHCDYKPISFCGEAPKIVSNVSSVLALTVIVGSTLLTEVEAVFGMFSLWSS